MNRENQARMKYVLPLFEESDPIRIFEIGHQKTPPLHSFGPAVRPYYLLHLVERGKGYIEREGVKTHLGAGDAFLIEPDELTYYCADEDEPWEYCWISFNGPFAKTLMKHTADKLFLKHKKSGVIAVKTALDRDADDYLGCLNTLFEVLNSVKSVRREAAETDVIASAMSYLENNYFQPIDIDSLSKSFGFSRAYFSTLFAKRTGETPYNYLTKIRIERAKGYLEADRHLIEEIAYSVGFSSLQRFSETFKKHVGLSPLAYRKEALKDLPRKV